MAASLPTDCSITKRVTKFPQPRGGYLNPKDFEVEQIDDALVLYKQENLHPSLVGLAVNYLTRVMTGTPTQQAFAVSLEGATIFDKTYPDTSLFKTKSAVKYAKKMMSEIKTLDRQTIINACKLAGYDVCARASINGYKPIETINPNDETIRNIELMVKRAKEHLRMNGHIVDAAFDFTGGYTSIISSGTGDFLTHDTLWTIKVSKNEPNSRHTLELLVEYIMGTQANYQKFSTVRQLGIYNPRLNKSYTIKLANIPDETFKTVGMDVIGYHKIDMI